MKLEDVTSTKLLLAVLSVMSLASCSKEEGPAVQTPPVEAPAAVSAPVQMPPAGEVAASAPVQMNEPSVSSVPDAALAAPK